MDEKAVWKQKIAQTMKNARIYAGLTQAQVADKLGITYQAVSNYERGVNSIETDILAKMCKMYHIDSTSALSTKTFLCPRCGLPYEPNDSKSIQKHEIFERAVSHYGFCFPWESLSIRKEGIYDILNSDNASSEEKYQAALHLFKVYFSRSIGQHRYSLEHPQFEDYAAMLLNQNRFKDEFGIEIYNRLVEHYGIKAGIPEGQTTYKIHQIIVESQTIDQKNKKVAKPYSDEALQLAEDFDGLDNHGQRVVRLVADEEKARLDGVKRPAPKKPTPPPVEVAGPAVEPDYRQMPFAAHGPVPEAYTEEEGAAVEGFQREVARRKAKRDKDEKDEKGE